MKPRPHIKKAKWCITRVALEWNAQGSRRSGRPNISWRRKINQELKKINKSFDKIENSCNNKVNWNNLVDCPCGINKGTNSFSEGSF